MNDVRTLQQNKHLHWLLGKLGLRDCLPELVYEETNGRTQHSSELTFIECMNLIRRLEQYLRKPQEHPAAKSSDKNRKRVIRAICDYLRQIGKDATVEYAKAIAVRAAARDSFNEITDGELMRIYNEFCRKQNVVKVKEEL